MTDKHSKMDKFMDSLTLRCPVLFDPSNAKFLAKVRSDMIAEGLDPELAIRVANALEFDLSAINEDDDLISQAATRYAEYAAKVLGRLKAMNMHKHISDAMIKKYFAHTYITF